MPPRDVAQARWAWTLSQLRPTTWAFLSSKLLRSTWNDVISLAQPPVKSRR